MGHFTFDGRRVPFEPGDTLGAALHRAGFRVLARSLRYHRPRGLYCNQGSCGSCLVDVEGVPNTPACLAPCRDGATVRSQNRIGSARHDLLGVADKVFRSGFDPHDAFTKPKLLNDVFLKGVRFLSGLGRAPRPGTHIEGPRRHALAVDELVVGGGTQGLQRALAAAAQGGKVLLVDEGPAPGGSARWHPLEGEAKAMAAGLGKHANLTVWTGSLCFGLYPGEGKGLLAAVQRPAPGGHDLWEATASRITLATGSHDAWPLFANNDLPGVLSLRGAMRLLGEHKVLPGREAVVHGKPLHPAVQTWLENAGVRILAQGQVEQARGGVSVEAALVRGQWIPCDAILCNLPTVPHVELAQQAGCRLAWRADRLVPETSHDGQTSVPGVFATLAPVQVQAVAA